MTHEFLDAPRLRAVCDMQREQIRLLRRQLAEKDVQNRRLQEQVVDLVGQVRIIPNEVLEALKGILVFSVPAVNVQNTQKWYDAIELVTEWAVGQVELGQVQEAKREEPTQ